MFSEVVEVSLRSLAVFVTVAIVVVQTGAETRFNPVKRRATQGLDALSDLEVINETVPGPNQEDIEIKRAGILCKGEAGFGLLTKAIKRNSTLNGEPVAYYLMEGHLPAYRGTLLHPEPSGKVPINPNSALMVIYSQPLKDAVDSDDIAKALVEKDVVDILEYRATDPYTTMELVTVRKWIREEVLLTTHKLVTGLVLIWATISVVLVWNPTPA